MFESCKHCYANKGSIAGTKTWAATLNAHYMAHLGGNQLRLASACDGTVPAHTEPMCATLKTLQCATA